MSYSRLAKRLRLPLGFALGILYLVYAPRATRPLSLAVGATIALVGVLIRAWAAGHIRKNDRLAMSGPYAHTRNPLYLGSFLIAAGFAIAAHWSLLLVVAAFWALVYVPTMQRERAHMGAKFPDAFPEFERNVPGFLPRLRPWRAVRAEPAPFSFERYMHHGEWKAALVYVLVVAWLAYHVRVRL